MYSFAGRYWLALRPLFESILESGDGNEIYSALFDLDIDNLVPVALKDLAGILQRAARTAKDSSGTGVMNSEGRVAEVLAELVIHPGCGREIASDIHQTWVAARARKEALDGERRWRDRGGI